jgi:hypothetical protein
MRLVADAFPHVPWLDPLIAWPRGAPIPWAAGFDLLGAVAIVLGRAVGGPAGGDLWVAALCPLLGVAVVAATMELVYALRAGAPGRGAEALAAGVLAAVLPQGVAISRYGRIDHHVAEALAMLLLARWAIAALPATTARTRRARILHEVGGAALAAGAVAVFTGSPLYVAIALPVLLGAALAAPRPDLVGSGGPGLLAGGALAALASASAVAAQGRTWAFGFPSYLQPLLLGAAGAAICGAVLVGARVAPGPRRLAAVLGSAAALAAAIALAVPGGAAQVVAGIREWLLTTDPWLRGIDEFQPLFRHPAGPAGGVNRFFGAAGFAAPLFLPLAALGARGAGRGKAAAFTWVTVALAVLALHQSRFGRVFAPFLAASITLGLAWLAGRFAPRGRLRALAPLAVAVALALLDARVRGAAGAEDDALPDSAIEGALDLRARTAGPAPGVLAPWDLGNAYLVVAGRPVVATGFGPYPDPSAYWEGVQAYKVSEAELLPWLAGRRVGWVVAGAANLFGRVATRDAPVPFAATGFSPAWLSQIPSAPLLIGGSGVPALGVRHLERLLPVFASTRTVGGIDGPLPVLWTYEVVTGARLTGRAHPGARVVLEIPLEEHGHPHTWRAFADAGGDGRWSMTVPLPTDLAAPTVVTRTGRLRVAGAAAGAVEIPEAAVRSGAEIALEPAPATPRAPGGDLHD